MKNQCKFVPNLLVCDRFDSIFFVYSNVLSKHFNLYFSTSVESAISIIDGPIPIHILVTSYLFGSGFSTYFNKEFSKDGLDIALHFREKNPNFPMIMISGGSPDLWPRMREFQNMEKAWTLCKESLSHPDFLLQFFLSKMKNHPNLSDKREELFHAS